jgi:hypothetical protein
MTPRIFVAASSVFRFWEKTPSRQVSLRHGVQTFESISGRPLRYKSDDRWMSIREQDCLSLRHPAYFPFLLSSVSTKNRDIQSLLGQRCQLIVDSSWMPSACIDRIQVVRQWRARKANICLELQAGDVPSFGSDGKSQRDIRRARTKIECAGPVNDKTLGHKTTCDRGLMVRSVTRLGQAPRSVLYANIGAC